MVTVATLVALHGGRPPRRLALKRHALTDEKRLEALASQMLPYARPGASAMPGSAGSFAGGATP
jgi:hypothetical protein